MVTYDLVRTITAPQRQRQAVEKAVQWYLGKETEDFIKAAERLREALSGIPKGSRG